MKGYRSTTIYVRKLGLINVNRSRDGFAYDAQGNTYQKVGFKWARIGIPKRDPVLSQSAGCAPMNGRHSVILVK